MKTIRKSVWETNSSSAHSLVVSRDDYFKKHKEVKIDYAKAVQEKRNHIINDLKGVMFVNLDEYGWGYDLLTGINQKLSYLIVEIAGNCMFYDKTEKDILEKLRQEGFLEFLEKNLGIKEIDFVGGIKNGHIDHQSQGLIRDTIGNYCSKGVLQFLVDDTVGIEIFNDNNSDFELIKKEVYIMDWSCRHEDDGVLMLENAPSWMLEE